MCLCWPYRNYIFDDAPKLKDKKEEKKPDWYLVKPGDVLYPAGVAELRHSSNVFSSFHFLASIFSSIHEGCSGFHVSEFAIASESSQCSLRCLLRTLVLLSSFIVHLTPAPRHRDLRTALVSSKHLT